MHIQACVQYILRVGVAEQMGEPAQKEFTFLLTKEVCSQIPLELSVLNRIEFGLHSPVKLCCFVSCLKMCNALKTNLFCVLPDRSCLGQIIVHLG